MVSTPIGNLSDISDRARQCLAAASLVVAEDTRRTGRLLEHLKLSRPLRSLHAHNEASRVPEIIEALGRGDDVALVSDAGTPLVSDPGERTVQAAIGAGFPVVPIPGPSAILASLIGSGLPCARFTFLGFVPRKGRDRTQILERIAASPDTVVVFESPERLVKLLEALRDVLGKGRRVSVARELTKIHEEFVRGTPAEVADRYREVPPRGEVTVVIEGAGDEEPEVTEAMIQAAAREVQEMGLATSAAAKEMAKSLGIPRREAYAVLQDLKDARGAEE